MRTRRRFGVMALGLAALALLLGGVGRAHADIMSGSGATGGGSPGGPTGGADPTFTFTYTDGTNIASGTLSAVPSGLGDGSLLATSGTLTVTGGAAVGTYSLIPAGPGPTVSPSGVFLVDDLIYPADNAGSGANNGVGGFGFIGNPSFLDNGGLLFGSGSTEINIFGNGGGDYAFLGFSPAAGVFGSASGGTFTPTAVVPEPSTLALLALGGLALAGWRRWRKRATA